MGLHNMFILIALTVIWQDQFTQAGVCSGRSTVIEIRIPQRTDVTVKYPTQIDTVKFVPYPGASGKANGQCYQCQGATCLTCNNINQNIATVTLPSRTRTNIIIDITGKKPDLTSKNGSKKRRKGDTLVILEDKTAAASQSQSAASGNGDTSATSAASSSTSNSDVIADLNETPQNNASDSTQDIFVADNLQSTSNALAKATVDPVSTMSQVLKTASSPVPLLVPEVTVTTKLSLHHVDSLLAEKELVSAGQAAPKAISPLPTEQYLGPAKKILEIKPIEVDDAPTSPTKGEPAEIPELKQTTHDLQSLNVPTSIPSVPSSEQPSLGPPAPPAPPSTHESSLPEAHSLPSSLQEPAITIPPLAAPAQQALNNDKKSATGLHDLGPIKDKGGSRDAVARAVAVAHAIAD